MQGRANLGDNYLIPVQVDGRTAYIAMQSVDVGQPVTSARSAHAYQGSRT